MTTITIVHEKRTSLTNKTKNKINLKKIFSITIKTNQETKFLFRKFELLQFELFDTKQEKIVYDQFCNNYFYHLSTL